MEEGKRFLEIPIQLLKGLLGSPRKRDKAINDMIAYCVFSVFVGFHDKKATIEETLEKVYDFLGIVSNKGIKGMKGTLNRGDAIAQSIKTKAYFFIDKSRLFDLRDKAYSNDLYVAMTMYYALGSIQGRKEYWKATNDFLLSRMDGRDKTITNTDRFSAPIKKINTRRKLDKYKAILELHYGVSFYGLHMHGFFFSTKLSKEELIKKLEEPKEKTKKPVKKIRKSDKETIKNMIKNQDFNPLVSNRLRRKCTT